MGMQDRDYYHEHTRQREREEDWKSRPKTWPFADLKRPPKSAAKDAPTKKPPRGGLPETWREAGTIALFFFGVGLVLFVLYSVWLMRR